MKITQPRSGATFKSPTQQGDRFSLPDDSVGTDALQDLAVIPSKLAASTLGPNTVMDLGLSVSVASNILTVALKQADGTSDPSTSHPVKVSLRSSTATSGGYSLRTVSSALSQTISSGTRLGFLNSTSTDLYVYLIDSDGAGTMKLGVSRLALDEGALHNVIPESGSVTVQNAGDTITWTGHTLLAGDNVTFLTTANGLTTNTPYYVINPSGNTFQVATTATGLGGTALVITSDGSNTVYINNWRLVSDGFYSSAAIRLIGRIVISEATAGVWASSPTEVSLFPLEKSLIGTKYTSSSTAITNGSTTTLVNGTIGSSFNNAAYYDTVTGKFVAPLDGWYRVAASFFDASASLDPGEVSSMHLYVNGSQTSMMYGFNAVGATNTVPFQGDANVYLTAYQILDVRITNGFGETITADGNSIRNWISFMRTGRGK